MPNWSGDDGRCYWRSPGEEFCCEGGRGCPMHDQKPKKRRRLAHPKSCPSRVADVFCTLASGHVGQCSFHLTGERADYAIHGLRACIAELEAERARLAEAHPGCSMLDDMAAPCECARVWSEHAEAREALDEFDTGSLVDGIRAMRARLVELRASLRRETVLAEGYEAMGRADERAAVVAWLRNADCLPSAEAIERGEHEGEI